MSGMSSKRKKTSATKLSSPFTQTKAIFGLVSAIVLFFGFFGLGRANTFVGKIQKDYNILGVSTDTCRTKADVNCDTKINAEDLGTVVEHIKYSNKPTPKPTTSPTPNASPKASPSSTPGSTPNATPLPSPNPTPNGNNPYPGAPPCPASAHSSSEFHTLWNSELRCHYDHEHGQNPFTAEVATTFPGFNLRSLLGNVGIGHTNPSGPMENTHKHGGFKWQVTKSTPENCTGFEGATNGANAAVIQYHGFGDYSMELETSIHSTASLIRLCNASNPTDYGYIYTVQHQNYGQRVVPYQGAIFNYPDTPQPPYDSPRGPYISLDCIGDVSQCRNSRELVLNRKLKVASTWTSKPTGSANVNDPFGSTLFNLLFRVRDLPQLINWNDRAYPFTFTWVCSSDNGITFNPAGCNYNNSTTQVHEIAGEIPTEWDNLAGFDSDSRVGRITAQGFTTKFGDLNTQCTTAGANCHPLTLVNAHVGKYGSILVYTDGKGTNLTPLTPERDIYFCNGVECSETSPGAVPSGWIGNHN